MKKIVGLMSCGVLLYAASCTNIDAGKNPKPEKLTPGAAISSDELRQRGEYLVKSIGCGDCHSPKKFTANGPEPEMDRLLSGYNSSQPLPKFDVPVMQRDHVLMFTPDLTASAGPWGVSFAANLTPDDTGIGNWTLDNFKRAMREGKFKGLATARDLLPPMPWPNFKNLNDNDIEAIFTYLKSIKPVKNLVPEAIPPGGAKK